MSSIRTWYFTATYDSNSGQWTYNGVGDGGSVIRVGLIGMQVQINVVGDGILLAPAGYGDGCMIKLGGQPTQPDWMLDLTRDSDTQFSFTDANTQNTWGHQYGFNIGYRLNGGPVQYTPDPTIMNLEPSGPGGNVHRVLHEAAFA
jgi:hypothetical protein